MIPAPSSGPPALLVIEGEFDAGTLNPGQNVMALIAHDLLPGQYAIPSILTKVFPPGITVFAVWVQGAIFGPSPGNALFIAQNTGAPTFMGVVKYVIHIYEKAALQ